MMTRAHPAEPCYVTPRLHCLPAATPTPGRSNGLWIDLISHAACEPRWPPTGVWAAPDTTTVPRQPIPPDRASSCWPDAHRAVSNLKAWLHGHRSRRQHEHLAVYLDEYVFRHNRRRTPMAAFQTLLGLGAAH